VSDQQLLYLAAFVRALATGLIGVLLGVYLGEIGLDAAAIGLIVSVGPAGAASATFVVTFLGDRLGHRRVLLGVTLLSAAGGVALALGSHPLVIGAAALLGMVNGMHRRCLCACSGHWLWRPGRLPGRREFGDCGTGSSSMPRSCHLGFTHSASVRG
jgi:MFS family permease